MKSIENKRLDILWTLAADEYVNELVQESKVAQTDAVIDPSIERKILRMIRKDHRCTQRRKLWNVIRPMLVACLIIATLALAACMAHPTIRKTVKQVLREWTNTSVQSVTTTTTELSYNSGPIRPEYINENAGKVHPITNPDAGEIPNVSYGNTSQLVYGNKVYYSDNSHHIWYSVDLANMISYDPQGVRTPSKVQSLCMEQGCQHKMYPHNNGILCPLYFSTHRIESINVDYHPIYCIDYTESKEDAPVFYILTNEPEYKVVDGEVVKNRATDPAIYRYDTADGTREIIAEDLPVSADGLTICGDYIYYQSYRKLTVIHKDGTEIRSQSDIQYILAYENGVLYLCDRFGNVYTANPDLSNLQEVFTVDTSALTEKEVYRLLESPTVPFGYQVEDGYLYFVNDCEIIWQSEKYEDNYDYVTSIYRVPLNDLSAEPELILDKQCWSGHFYGIAGGKLYYIPPINYWGDSQTSFTASYCLAYVDLTTKETKVMEEFAFDMPHYGIDPRYTHCLNSEFLIGASRNYGSSSYFVLYHFDTGDLMFISRYEH